MRSTSNGNQENKIDAIFKKAWQTQMKQRSKNLPVLKVNRVYSKKEGNVKEEVIEITKDENVSFMMTVHPFTFVFTVAIASAFTIVSFFAFYR